jgi:hypothetical protein
MPSTGELSTEAKIGQALLLAGIVVGAAGLFIATVFLLFVLPSLGFPHPVLFLILLFAGIIGVIKLAGVLVGVLAYRAASRRDLRKAGILGIIASVLPPFDLIMLIGGILCTIRPESKEWGAPPLTGPS